MTQYDNTNSGFIGKNERKRAGKKDPDITGFLNVEGKEFWVKGWKNSKGYGLRVNPKEAGPAKPQDDGKDIPF